MSIAAVQDLTHNGCLASACLYRVQSMPIMMVMGGGVLWLIEYGETRRSAKLLLRDQNEYHTTDNADEATTL